MFTVDVKQQCNNNRISQLLLSRTTISQSTSYQIIQFGHNHYFNLHFISSYLKLLISQSKLPGRVAQSVGHLTRKPGVLGLIPGLATYFRFFFRFFKKGSIQLLAKVCARSTGLPLRRSKPAQEKCG